MKLNCLKPGCPIECGTRRRPACADRMLCRALFLLLAAVLLFSLVMGFRDLTTTARSHSVVPEPPPVAAAKIIQLVSETPDHARQRILGDLYGKPAISADELIQVPQQS